MSGQKYFVDKKKGLAPIIKIFLSLLFVFAVAFFLWSVMRYNKIMDEKAEKEEYIAELETNISELQYWVDYYKDNYGMTYSKQEVLESLGEKGLRRSAMVQKMHDYLLDRTTVTYRAA